MVAINTNRKQKLVKGLTAGAAVLGVGAIASFSAWTASQTFTTDASVADAPADSIEYSVDMGETWQPFDDGEIVLEWPTINSETGFASMLPGESIEIILDLRNTSTDTIFYESATTPHSFIGTGEMFEGTHPAILTQEVPSHFPLQPDEAITQYYTLTVPDDMPTDYSGATGEIVIDYNYDTVGGN